MQLLVRGSSNYSVEASSVEELFLAVSAQEGSDEVLVYANGKPVSIDADISEFQNVTFDVTVPLVGGKVRMSSKLTKEENE